MRIARLELKEIGPFDDAVFEIPAPPEGQTGELVVFDGPNGSGKTTIAQAIACAAEGARLPPQQDNGLGAPKGELVARVRGASPEAVKLRLECAGEVAEVGLNRSISWEAAPRTHAITYAIAQVASGVRLAIAWAGFAYRGHQPTPIVHTGGPAEIGAPPLRGALSFGAFEPASAHFGQLLVNLDQDVAKAFREAHRDGLPAERRQDFEHLAVSRQKTLDEIARALSEVLDRKLTFEVPVGLHAPLISIDGERIPLELLGEGMRSTFAWLSDLLVRLHRIAWENAARSPLEQDFWLILDEIDESLHPTMQMRILPALRRLFPRARIYITTHSPFVVASAGEGHVFSIRPDAGHHVSGTIPARKLEPGQSLEWVVEEIFGAETGFIDVFTRDALRAHRADINRLRRKEAFGEGDWRAFLDRRARLLDSTEQVQTVVAMQEVPVARLIEARLAEGEA
jgi:energy-coupling factor transporter ATP-binding protein EcfA2